MVAKLVNMNLGLYKFLGTRHCRDLRLRALFHNDSFSTIEATEQSRRVFEPTSYFQTISRTIHALFQFQL